MISISMMLDESNGFVNNQQLLTEKHAEERRKKHDEFTRLTNDLSKVLNDFRKYETSLEEEAERFSHDHSQANIQFTTTLTKACGELTSIIECAANNNLSSTQVKLLRK